MKKILVTGAAGFIGSTLCERLLQAGCQVIGIDNFDSYYSIKVKEQNLKNCLVEPNFKLVKSDLLEVDYQAILSETDYIFHLSARPGVRADASIAPLYWQQNLQATLVLLEAAQKHPIKKLIFASTSSIYGLAEHLPFNEADEVYPISYYGISKLAAEKLCFLYQVQTKLPIVILRFFSVYGPKQRPDMAFDRFIRAMLVDQPITVYGDGDQTRDFTYIDDIIAGALRVIECDLVNQTINLGGGSRVSLRETIAILEKLLGKKAKISFAPSMKCEPRHTLADISKAKSLLDFNPQTKIAEGLARQVEYIKKSESQ